MAKAALTIWTALTAASVRILILLFCSRSFATDNACNMSLPTQPRQLVVVVSDDWRSQRARMHLFRLSKSWQSIAGPIDVAIGRSGLAWGRGVHRLARSAPAQSDSKREGDGKSPAGIFTLGRVFGDPRYAWDVRLDLPVSSDLVCIDEPRHPEYNQTLRKAPLVLDTQGVSYERMYRYTTSSRTGRAQYDLGVEVAHNSPPTLPGHGSCIFLHLWGKPHAATAGCTSMSRHDLETVIAFIRRDPRRTLIAQVPKLEYRKMMSCFGFPSPPLDPSKL